jgi:hypothetical protein
MGLVPSHLRSKPLVLLPHPAAMKSLSVSLALFLGLLAPLGAQEPGVSTLPAASVGPQRSPEELEQLLAPIALYPDALLAIILPAATAPTDIVLAARYLRDNPGDRSQIEHRAWDESVKSLTSYPEVVLWLDDNLSWTQQIGDAFARQSADVMQAVQRLRAKARAAGTLVDTPQQQVIAEPEVIRIVPSQPDIIYVPHYEPDIVFVDRPVYYPYSRPFLTFGIGVPVGSWLAFDCDWRRNTIWVGNRHRHWGRHDWHRPVVPIAPAYRSAPITEVRQWRPPAQSIRPPITASNRFRTEIARPSPIGVTTARTYTPRPSGYSDRDRRRDSNPVPGTSVQPPTGLPRTRNDFVGPRVPDTTTSPSSAITPPSGSMTVSPTPNLQPLPQARRPDRTRNDFVGPRTPDTTPPSSTAITPPSGSMTVSPAPNLQPLPQTRRPDRTPDNDNGNRNRSFRGNPPASAPTVSVAPASPPPSVPQPNQSYNRGTPRSFSGDNSRVNSTPRNTPPAAAPVTPRSAPAATPAPAPTNTAPASPPPQGGESRGHRGSYRRDGNSSGS